MDTTNKHVYGWQDFLELVVACWLLASPFMLGYFGEVSASLTALLVGTFAILFAILGLSTQMIADEWGNLGIALSLIASPWMFGYSHLEVATINAIASGIILAVLAALAMKDDKAELKKLRVSH